MNLSAGGQLAISALGAKKFGSSAWGVLGAGIGVLLGTVLIPIPVAGSLLGAFLGALALELFVAQPRARAKAEAPLEGRDGAADLTPLEIGHTKCVVEVGATIIERQRRGKGGDGDLDALLLKGLESSSCVFV